MREKETVHNMMIMELKQMNEWLVSVYLASMKGLPIHWKLDIYGGTGYIPS